MKNSLTCLLVLELALVGAGQAAPANAESPRERDVAVDQALGGLEEGSRMLAPRGQGAAEAHSGASKPGGATSPRDAGAVKSDRGAGAVAKPESGPRATIGNVGAQVGTVPSVNAGGGTGTQTSTGSGSSGGGDTSSGTVEEPGVTGGSETGNEPPVSGETGGGTGGGTEPTSPDSGTSNNLIELDVDSNSSTGQGSADLSVGGEPVIETDVSTGADLSGATEPVTEDISTTLDAGVVTDTTTIDAGTETTEGDITVDVSAGSDTLGDALLGTGSELDPDATTAEETTDILDDCSALDPLSLPDHCL